MTAATPFLRRLLELDDTEIEALAALLIDCVEGGASVSFMHPLARERAVAFWRRVAQGVATGERALLVAEDGPVRLLSLSRADSVRGSAAASRASSNSSDIHALQKASAD